MKTTLTLRGEKKLDTGVTEEEFHRTNAVMVRSQVVRAAADGRGWQGQRQVQGRSADGPTALRDEAKPRQIKVAVAVAA